MICEENVIHAYPSHLYSICPHIKKDKRVISSITLKHNNISELDVSNLLEFPMAKEFDFSINELTKVSGKSMGKNEAFRWIICGLFLKIKFIPRVAGIVQLPLDFYKRIYF